VDIYSHTIISRPSYSSICVCQHCQLITEGFFWRMSLLTAINAFRLRWSS